MRLSRREFVRTAVAAVAGTAVAGSAGQAGAGVAPQGWMGALPDGTSLLRLTIPGTHDSGCTDPGNGTEWSHTQNWSIGEQFQRGIRFLDMRCNGLQDHMSDSFGIYHTAAYQGLTFDNVLDTCRDFLARNPGEVIVMRVKKENGTKNDVGGDFERIFNGYLDIKGYRSLFWIGDRIPALGEARGRIVLIAQFANQLPALQWPVGDNGVFTNDRFYLQDRYRGNGLLGLDSGSGSGSGGSGSSGTGSSGGDKYSYVRDCLDKAAADTNNSLMYINFTSYSDNAWPKDNAAAIMPKVEGYLTEHRAQPAHFGMVPMDFPDRYPNVLNLLLEKNFL
ncbi:phosphatidylinositol-specific phospholipase C [Nocardia acidivorans]|uniref:phosphatidylinositol-specific phospholipase C n=1 Tax=Nocardia acidivorans TaxID=404580 RepID=UPI000A73BB99|nr:phosphatidylinositol-specific phospholipase C [Nocardia acidivorans]